MSALQDFQVILLAGITGRRLQPLTESLPKCLLPVGNRTLLSYCLEFIAKAGFQELLLISNEAHEETIGTYVNETFRQESSAYGVNGLRIQFEVVADYVGTASTLLHVRDKITRQHIIVLTADLIVDPSFLSKLADSHRSRDAAVTALLYPVNEETTSSKRDATQVVDYVAIDDDTDRLLLISNSAQVEGDFLKIKRSLIQRFPRFTLHTQYHDSHLYVFSTWTLHFLEERKELLQSIGHHFLPFLLRAQYRTNLINGFKIPNSISKEARAMSSTYYNDKDPIRCYAWKLSPENFCCRISDVSSYLYANRALAGSIGVYMPTEPQVEGKQRPFIGLNTEIHQRTQIPSGCIIGEGTKIGERVGVKKSIIGKHCLIGANAKILNSVIMDHVHIAENAKIQNSVIGSNSYVEADVEVTESQVGSGCNLEAGTVLSRKKVSNRELGLSSH